MVHAVIDTNVLVSALLASGGKPAKILALALEGIFIPCFDDRIFQEYENVLHRPKFPFSGEEIADLFDRLHEVGLPVSPPPLNVSFADVSDRKFYETAKFCCAWLITGNCRHYPQEPWIVTPAQFLEQLDAI